MPAIFILQFFVYSSANAQGVATNAVDLSAVEQPVSVKHFYIAQVIDERMNKTTFGKLIQAATPMNGAVAVNTDIKGGSLALIALINKSVVNDRSLRPVVVKLRILDIKESAVNGWVQGHIKLSADFGLMHDEEFIKLDDYTAESTYQRRPGNVQQQTVPLLRNAVASLVTYIDKWIALQADNNIALAKGVSITFKDHHDAVEGDTVYYDVTRPLTWADFKDHPRSNSKYGAEVYASLGYDEDVKLVKGVIQIQIALKVYLPKSACWARPEAMDDWGLNHEQRHYDIVKMAAGHFTQTIMNMKPDVYNYDGPINVAYLDALREIDKLQKQYDGDTAHSRNASEQLRWNALIDKELVLQGVKTVSAQAAFK